MKCTTILCRIVFVVLFLTTSSVQAGRLTSLTSKLTTAMSDLPRYEKLPLFNPHRKLFTCLHQDQHVPPVDPQAELWFQQALVLDNPDIYYKDRDYPKIYQLYQQAAQRNHWKSMLNLASLILSDYAVPEHDPEVAIRWVEKAMQLGVPDAYDMMGTYHQNGMIRGGDATSAYAFFQRAADMGSPSAMTFLGYKIAGTYDDPEGEFWGNLPIGRQMLECALAQGYGDAADKLGLIYARPNTSEAKFRALRVLHEGVKLGSAECANSLFSEFDGLGLASGTNLIGRIDKARAERYSQIGNALEHYQGRLKLPNLDKVLPLPPAPLPKWDGNKQTLIDAAKTVIPPAKPKSASHAALQGREQMPEGHSVMPLAESAYSVHGGQRVPETGYWLALFDAPGTPRAQLTPARSGRPEHYQAGERFEPATMTSLSHETMQWHYLGEARQLPPSREMILAHMVSAGWLREISASTPISQCAGHQRCPQQGIWEGRVAVAHPQAFLYNTWTQQAFVDQGQPFPDPRERALAIDRHDVTWTYLGSPNIDGAVPGVTNVAL
ncbi:TPR repeat protein [Paraburkholderia sp. BL6669N2]|uniref:sel1 repeat family protein n=1 Tax=Paraburkholderia sp. BL6669N2 TaxID=1938807 RepID=UPI000E3A55BC|nr:sel1 repeat family protein [Paraburkholderia sp. BL6669N2]REG61372.1 TPR repeat protein [Paraburkholderia sp. BL6669N2]